MDSWTLRRSSRKMFCLSSKYLPVAGMNCHMPAALAEDTACGLNADSMKGSKANSVGMLRFSSSSTMKNRYLRERSVMRSM